MNKLHLIFLPLLVFCIQLVATEQTSDDFYRSICSNFNRSTPVVIEVSSTQEGYLLSHDFDGRLVKNGHLVDKLTPFHCNWQLLLLDNDNKEFVSLEFLDFDIPETDEVDVESDDGDENNAGLCSSSYVKISSMTDPRDEPEFLAGYCGNGLVPVLEGQVGKSLLVEVKITQPFRGFRIKFKKMEETGEGKAMSGFCNGGELCPDPLTGLKCIPSKFKCDGRRDCYGGEDEDECEVADQQQNDSGCGSPRRTFGEQGVIRSMGYPNFPYDDDARCQWLITTPPGTRISIEFQPRFSIEMHDDFNADECLYDSLSFFVLNDTSDEQQQDEQGPITLYSKICGALPPPVTTIPHNRVMVVFETNDHLHFDGFEFKWRAVQTDEDLRVSNQDVDGQTVIYTDPATEVEEVMENGDDSNVEYRAKWPGSSQTVNENNPCSPKGATLSQLSGMISTPLNVKSGVSTCTWTVSPRLPAGSTQTRVDFRFYDFTVDPLQDCEKPVLEIVFETMKGKRGRGVYTCKKMPPFEEAEFARTTKPVQIIFHTNNGKRNSFELGFIVITTRGKVVASSNVSVVTNKPSPSTFALVKHCGRSTAPIPAPSIGGSAFAPTTRIVGGMPAKPGSWPWAAELLYRGKHMCGATILDDTAHCFKQPELHQKAGWEVVIGRHTITSQTAWDRQSPILRPRIKRIMVHKRYTKTPGDKSYDIALIQLDERIRNGKIAHPACLPSRPLRTTDRCFVVGWGDTRGTGGDGVLKQASMPVFENSKCKAMNSLYTAQVKSSMVCAGYQAGGIDSCQGDSGGPLTCYVNGRWEIHGIVSFGKGCAGANAPGVYTRVYSYLKSWIAPVTTLGLKQRRSVGSDEYYRSQFETSDPLEIDEY